MNFHSEMAQLITDVQATTAGRRLLAACLLMPQDFTTARQVAKHLKIPYSTLLSRCARRGLTSPRRLLAVGRLGYAINFLGQRPDERQIVASQRYHYSSPQSLGRTARSLTGFTAGGLTLHADQSIILNLIRRRLDGPWADFWPDRPGRPGRPRKELGR